MSLQDHDVNFYTVNFVFLKLGFKSYLAWWTPRGPQGLCLSLPYRTSLPGPVQFEANTTDLLSFRERDTLFQVRCGYSQSARRQTISHKKDNMKEWFSPDITCCWNCNLNYTQTAGLAILSSQWEWAVPGGLSSEVPWTLIWSFTEKVKITHHLIS